MVIAGAVGYFYGNLPEPLENWMLFAAAALVVFLLVLLPFLSWWSRTYTITTRRVIERSGILSARRRELTHVRGYSIEVKRGPLQRMWRTGTLTLSNGVDEPMRLANIPSVDLVHECLVDQVEVNQILAHRDAQPLLPLLPPSPDPVPFPVAGWGAAARWDDGGEGRSAMALRVGVVGGGQLARMMIAPAVELGVELQVLAEEPGMSASLAASAVGDYRDLATVLAFAREVDVVTFDHEHVPQAVLTALVDAGVAVHPGRTRCASRRTSSSCARACRSSGCRSPTGRPCPRRMSCSVFLDAHGGRAVVKTPRGGYDGKGVRVVSAATEADDWFAALAEDARGGALLVEELVDFSRELAQQVARRPSGEMRVYPVVETVQRDGVCAEVIAPAPHSSERLVRGRRRDRHGHRGGPGRDRDAGRRALRDHRRAAPRQRTRDAPAQQRALEPGRRRHQPVRAAPPRRARPAPRRPRAARARGRSWSTSSADRPRDRSTSASPRRWRRTRRAKVHTYGKAPRPGRKVGHVNASAATSTTSPYQARAAASFFLD